MADGFVTSLAAELAEALRQVVREELIAAGVTRPPEKEWLTLEEAAEFLGYSRTYVHRRKDIPRHSMGSRGAGRMRFKRTELEEWLTRQPGQRT